MRKIVIVLQMLCVCVTAFGETVDLSKFERSVFSQQGEDGVIEKILSVVGVGSKYCVEFGGYDGVTCSNARKLMAYEDWKGVMFDGGYQNLALSLHKEFITEENINSVFEKYGVPSDLDLLSIDIDFNDFHVWKALSQEYRPRLVVIEFNATFLPHEDRVVPYSAYYAGDGTNYFGASILAMFRLARSKGYSLVYVENRGVNLFFVRDDLLEQADDKFQHVNDVNALYVHPKYGQGPNGGHKRDPLNRSYTSSQELLSF